MKFFGLVVFCFGISLCGTSQLHKPILDPLESASDQWLVQITTQELSAKLDPQNCITFTEKRTAGSSTEIEAMVFDQHCATLLEIKALSDLYFPLFEKKLESLGLDDNYKYLPAALSGFNPHYEGSFDRAGLWQLSFAVSKRFGLTISTDVDERKAADLSTDAALAQLKFLNKKFDGDQLMVTLAFIRSPMYAQKLRNKCELNGVSMVDGLEPLDQAWLDYLTMLEEFINDGASNSALFDFIKQLNKFENMAFTKDVSYDALSSILGLDKEELKGANPAYHHEIIPGGYHNVVFIMPKEKAALFPALADSIYSFEDQRLAAIEKQKVKEAEKIVKGIPDMTNREQKTYKVRSGDVLGSIAERHGVRVSDLKAWNDVRGDMIYVGQTLVLYPKKGKTKPDSKPADKAEKPADTTSSANATNTTTGSFENYTVQPGESLWLIAKKFPGVSSDNIMKWNGIEADILPGQVLKIYK
jgi:membrane-bound lytic murein transglycosylase D